MNESLRYLNTVFHSGNDFEKIWKSFDCDKSTEGLKKEIQSRLNTIEKHVASLNEGQTSLLIEIFENLINKGKDFYGKFSEGYKFYDMEIYYAEKWYSIDLIDDPVAAEKSQQKAIKEFEIKRGPMMVKLKNMKSTVQEIINELKGVQKRLSLEQIKIPGLVMDKGEMNTLKWQKTDTDLLELVTALFESGSITNSTKDLTRKEAINSFMQFFGVEIKDAESKLSRATNRKKDVSQYLTNLKTTFEDYAKAKDERLDSQRY